MKTMRIEKFPKIRKLVIDILDIAVLQHTITGFTEYDVSKPREIIKKIKEKTKERISFLAYFTNCLAKAVDECKILQGMKIGNRKIVVFDDVDVCTLLEAGEKWQRVPLMYVVRNTNHRELKDINEEIQKVKTDLSRYYQDFTTKISKYLFVPGFIRKLYLRIKYRRDPKFRKNLAGTVCLSSVGPLFGNDVYGWGLPVSFYPLYIVIGSIVKKPAIKNNNIAISEFVNVSISIDHDIMDGAPGARFALRLKELVESGYGLPEI